MGLWFSWARLRLAKPWFRGWLQGRGVFGERVGAPALPGGRRAARACDETVEFVLPHTVGGGRLGVVELIELSASAPLAGAGPAHVHGYPALRGQGSARVRRVAFG